MFGRPRFSCLYCAGMPVVVPGHAPIRIVVIEGCKVLKEVSPNGPSDSEVSDRRYSLRSHGALFLYPICVVSYRSSDFDAVRVSLSR